MPEDNAAADNEATVLQPHGREQQVKMEILDMIHGGKDPFAIIYHVAKWLEKVSGGFSFEHSCPKCHSHNIDLYFGPFGPYYICGVCGSESKPEELV